MTESENRFTPELDEKEVIELLENATPGSVFNETIIPLALVGCHMIVANSVLRSSFAIYHLISNTCLWNNIVK